MAESPNRWTHDELLKPLFEALGSACLVVTPAGQVLAISDAARRRVERLDARPVIDVASVFTDEPALREMLAESAESGQVKHVTLHARSGGEPVRVVARQLVPAGAGRTSLTLIAMQGIGQPGDIGVSQALSGGMAMIDMTASAAARSSIEETAPRLKALSLQDTLTGLPDRRSFTQRMSREWSRAARLGNVMTLIVADIDRFSAYNVACGSDDGDRVLRQIALVLMNAASRENDCAFRIGGEEFAVLLPGTPLDGGQAVAGRIVDHLVSLALPHPAQSPERITLSLGVAAAMPPAGDGWRDLVKRAEGAVYLAKRDGRNRIVADPARLPRSRARPVR